MHEIQYHIIDQLLHHQSRRFSELKIKSLESSLFQYHLKYLIKQGLVEKTLDGKYQLSPGGIYFVDRLSLTTKTPRPQPKLTTIVVLRNERDEFLLYQEHRQPYIDTWRFPAGKIHENERLADAAAREIREKFGMEIDGLRQIGAVHLRTFECGELTIENYAFIFVGNYDGELPAEAMWFDADDKSDLPLMPGVREVIDYVQNDQHEVHEYDVIV